MGKNKKKGKGGPKPQTHEEPKKETDQPGPSWGQGDQPPIRFQTQSQQPQEMYQSQPQQSSQSVEYQTRPQQSSQPAEYQARPQQSSQFPMYQKPPQPSYSSHSQQPSKSWKGKGEPLGGDGDFSRRLGGLKVGEKEQRQGRGSEWGRVIRKGGKPEDSWGHPHSRQESPQFHRPAQTQQQYEQQTWPRPTQSQTRPQSRGQFPQSQSYHAMPQPQQQVVPGPGGAWAKGPPQDLQKSAQEKGKPPASEQTKQPDPKTSTEPQKEEEAPKSSKKKQERSQELQLSDYMDFAPRIPASQKNGRSILVEANFFPLSLQNYDITVYHYDVVFEPDVPKTFLRKAWNTASEKYFPRRITVFDGMSNVYTKGPLPNGTTFRGEFKISQSDNTKAKEYTLMLKEVRRIPMTALSNYKEKLKQSQTIEARKKALPLSEVSIIEVILKNWPANKLIQHNRVFFPKKDMNPRTWQLSDRLELRYGYFQSAFLGYKLYLNFDVAHRPFYRSDYLKSLISDLSQNKPYFNPEEANHFIKGAKLEYALPDDRRMKITYRANKMVDDALTQTFERDGKIMTVAEYFHRDKGFTLKYPRLPLLWVGPTSKTIYLPLELVKMADDQIFRGALNSSETRKMVSGATSDARRRKSETLQAFATGEFQDNPYLKEFGIIISQRMETVKARVLEPPKLKTTVDINVKEGAWKTRSFLDAKSFNRWCILNLDKSVNKNALIGLQRSLQAKAKDFNMMIGEPTFAPVDKGGTVSFFDLQKIFSGLKSMNIVIVVISDVKGLYSKVKTICETQEGILTQCIRGKNITGDQRRIMTTLDNLVLKINAKLGGINHSLNQTSTPPCLEGYVMVVGADVTHAGPGSKIPSVAAVAVTSEVSAFQYGITIRVQHGEIIQDLKEIMKQNLNGFYNLRRKLPEKIFFFRDGVSEGEMEKVLKTEYRALKEACEIVGCTAKITFLVVQKRHHTRFYPSSSADEEGKTFNVPVGTCVDSDVVHPSGLDFYLLSHGSLLGTARPTRYRLLHDDNRLTDDELEQLTFYLCHLYARCNRSVSYPSPTYNAHLAAFRARAYLEGLNLTDRDDLKEVQAKLKDSISANYPMFFV